MKVIDCFWEQKNIGKKTIEISIEEADRYDSAQISQVAQHYEYIVVKVPMNKPEFNIGLGDIGFVCIESQLNVGIKMIDFNFSKVSHLYDDTSYEIVDSQESLQSVITNIQPGMFSTDRIAIDSQFGEDIGCQRYINWIMTEYNSKKSELIKVIYKNEHVGFMLIRREGEIIHLLLNGLYKPYQRKGLGMLTPASPMMYAKKASLLITQEETSISSNNIPVVKLYNRLGFQILHQTYVFIKHHT
ncbi:MAG: hypothetical protein J1E58_02920 [Prevotella sp.]|nr:hypothetical protein [Prevotella sp.]